MEVGINYGNIMVPARSINLQEILNLSDCWALLKAINDGVPVLMSHNEDDCKVECSGDYGITRKQGRD